MAPHTANSALYDAVKKGDKAEVTRALMADANPDLREKTGLRRCVLQMAVDQNHYDMVSILLNFDADPNVTDDNDDSPLHGAIAKKYFEIADLLLKKGADIHIRGTERLQLPPIHKAILMDVREGETFDRTAYLLTKGADINVVNRAGENAEQYAVALLKHYPIAKDMGKFLFIWKYQKNQEEKLAERDAFDTMTKSLREGTQKTLPKKTARFKRPNNFSKPS